MDASSQLELLKRKTVEIISEEDLLTKLRRSADEGRPLQVKLGLDPSAPDIHLGHTVVLRKMKDFQDLGHEVVLIVGDFTGRIGDPTGKSETRNQLTQDEVMENARTYQEQVFKILDRNRTKVAFNSSWLSELKFEDLIVLASKTTVARMLERDDFSQRYNEGKPIRIHEFFYPLMQAYDSIALASDVELGGTDQKFNILMGRTLQREYGQEPQVAVLTPILVGTDGTQKMSKSLGNYIGVKDSQFDMYGKTMSIPDEIMIMYYDLVTALPYEEVRAVERGLADGALHPMDVKRRLAREIVKAYHSGEAALEAEEEFNLIFKQGDLPDEIPEVVVKASELKDGKMWVVRLLAMCGLAISNTEARRLVDQGAVRINERQVDDSESDVEVVTGTILRVGKRRFVKVRLVQG